MKVTVVPVAPFFQLSGRLPTMELYAASLATVSVRELAPEPAVPIKPSSHEFKQFVASRPSVASIVTLLNLEQLKNI